MMVYSWHKRVKKAIVFFAGVKGAEKKKGRGRPRKDTYTNRKRRRTEISKSSEDYSDDSEDDDYDDVDDDWNEKEENDNEVNDNAEWILIAEKEKKELLKHIKDKGIQSIIECFNIKRHKIYGGKRTVETIENKNKDDGINIRKTIKLLKKDKKEMEENTPIGQLSCIVVKEIEKRMPKKCGECSIFYTDTLTENKTIKCTMCNIGHHGCVKRTETEIKGWKWICEECESIFAENDDELLENLRAWVSLATFHITKKKITKNKKKKKGARTL